MSRTYKTNPFWVRMRRGHIRTEEMHDHSNGVCDLPAEINKDWWLSCRNCNHHFLYTGKGLCACPMCHEPTSRHIREARERREFRDNPDPWMNGYR